MPFFDWDMSYSVNLEHFDNHHKELIRLLNEAHGNFMAKVGGEATRIVIDRLIDYAQFHFSAEEKWMATHNYPGLKRHTAEHDAFWRKLFDFQKMFHEGKKQLSFEVLTFLKEWLIDHILISDAEYGKFGAGLRQKQI